MKKKLMWTLAMLIAVTVLARPYDGYAKTESQKLEDEIKQLEKQMNALESSKRKAERDKKKAQSSKQNAQKESEAVSSKKELTLADIDQLNAQIETATAELMETQGNVANAEEELHNIGVELEETTKKKLDQDELFQDRIRLLYKEGAVSYLDVLLSSVSFSDFLERYDAVQSIMLYDKDMLTKIQSYEKQVEEQQAKKDEELENLKDLYAQRADQVASLEDKEQEKEVMIAAYNKQLQDKAQVIAKSNEIIEESEEISEEAERKLTAFAKKMSALEAKKNSIKNYYKGGKLGMPLQANYKLSSPFGYRIHPITGKKKLHAGMDMAVAQGTPIYAAESGVVIVAQAWSGYGNCVIIDHGGGLWTLYGHIKANGILVEKGQTVKRGQKIALVGSTGQSTGPHLHFEVRKNSEPVNPAPYLK
ncbi:murein hydrolase activator EnvC family protein [Cohnella faecalis]|uniref:Uncharacterized protein n=1 Tax=Cohnella faecalis TaxID=2315694 RepID=A0A398CFZ5_9BACL|nr:M23 family metallopeptidase [Cohnella faecalis]RIE02116.1 hypothetical protein D3H35_15260 [Cohnella faecalis]